MKENEIKQLTLQLAATCKEPDDFISKLEQSFKALQGDTGALFHQVGAILFESYHFALATASWKHAAQYATKNGNRRGQLACYGNIGVAYKRMGDFRKAIEYQIRALRLAELLKDKLLMAQCHNNLGNSYNAAGDSRTAIEHHEKSLQIASGIADRVQTSEWLGNLGCAYDNLGDYGKAIEYHNRSLDIAEAMANGHGQATCHNNLGSSLSHLGDFAKAIQHHEKSLRIARETEDRALEADCLGNLGNDYSGLGYSKKAIEYYEESLRIAKEIGDKVREAKSYLNLGTSYGELAQHRKAIEYFREGLKIAKEAGDLNLESSCYADVGIAEHKLGNTPKAIELLEKSLEIVQRLGIRAAEAKCYANLANAYASQGDGERAISYTEKSLEIAKEIGDKAMQSKCHRNLGISYYDLGDFGRAVKKHEESLDIAIEIGDKAGEAECYGCLADTYHSLGNIEKAKEYWARALYIAREIGHIALARTLNFNLALVYGEDNPTLAYDYCKQSIELAEMIIEYLVEEEHKVTFRAEWSDAHRLMVHLCLRLGRQADAYEYLERSKSRVILDLLAATEIQPTVKATSDVKLLLDHESVCLAKLRALQIAQSRRRYVHTEFGEIEGIRDSLNAIYDRLELLDPEYVSLRRGQPLSLTKIQEMLSAQKRNVVLIEYFMTTKETFIFVLRSKDNALHVEAVPLSQERLRDYVENYQREMTSPPGSQDTRGSWLGLSDYIIKPISQYLAEDDIVYFVPYGLLHYLPIHAFEMEGEPLISRNPVAYSPSASLIAFSQNKGSGELLTCAAFGVEFEEESQEIARLFDTVAFNGPLATKSQVIRTCSGKDIIHFSCHGYFDSTEPLASAIKLADDWLSVREVFGMRLHNELVTLSACQTGINQRKPGEELIGLTRAFMYAGSPSVIVSLCSVNAASTQELMLEFYRRLKAGRDKATALQEAQKSIMARKEYSHPYYWAPFVLVGDWQ